MRLITVATCALNQWALDFEGNYRRILHSIITAKSCGAVLRTGPELEICGYGCNDHFYEMETFEHCWDVLARLLSDRRVDGVICDIGMPILHQMVRYNCRVVIFNGHVLLIRPKMTLANGGNYRESRWFTAWARFKSVETFILPKCIYDLNGQRSVPIGDAIVQALDFKLGLEICEELFAPKSPHVDLGLRGVDVICNGSASHHELRKLDQRVSLIRHASQTSGGVYLYANQKGCDGERLYYDGSAMIFQNGTLLAQSQQFSLDEIDIIFATVDLDQVSSYRAALPSRSAQAALSEPYPVVELDIAFVRANFFETSLPIAATILKPQDEIRLGPACWLWDYLRRSGIRGFFLPLSGGIDSCSTALLVLSMCRLVYEKLLAEDSLVTKDILRIVGRIPTSVQDLVSEVFCTSFMASSNSSFETRKRASDLAKEIGSHHVECDISEIIASFTKQFETLFDKSPRFAVHGGSSTENLALQNIQARSRMVMAYLLAQLVPWTKGAKGGLLVLGSANVDECLRGYFTKYDCSSADLNPIGSISKRDLRLFVELCKVQFCMPILESFLNADPAAELEPVTADHVQTDEKDMGFTYDELSEFGVLRKLKRCGPVDTFKNLLHRWSLRLRPAEIANKTKSFFRFYAMNRHKMTTLTPSYHAEGYSPDDNRFDLRPFLYNTAWDMQFQKIDEILKDI